jgi:hypothetical protein
MALAVGKVIGNQNGAVLGRDYQFAKGAWRLGHTSVRRARQFRGRYLLDLGDGRTIPTPAAVPWIPVSAVSNIRAVVRARFHAKSLDRRSWSVQCAIGVQPPARKSTLALRGPYLRLMGPLYPIFTAP